MPRSSSTIGTMAWRMATSRQATAVRPHATSPGQRVGSPPSADAGHNLPHLAPDTVPNHLMGVMTAHLGCAHAGRHRAGWAKGARSWRTPSGPRTPPRPTAPAIRWSTTSRRSPPAWRARWHRWWLPPRRRSPAPPSGSLPFRSLCRSAPPPRTEVVMSSTVETVYEIRPFDVRIVQRGHVA